MYYVEQKYYDSGVIITKILNQEEVEKLDYHENFYEEKGNYDLYVDGFKTMKEAEKFAKDAKNA